MKISYSLVFLSISMIIGNIGNLDINFAYSEEEYTFSKTWGSAGTEDGQFMFPHSLAIDTYGNIYVTDTGNDRVSKI
ncbi:MAG: SBBP repeat-containing protein [Nitrososphaeraceae archaeon]